MKPIGDERNIKKKTYYNTLLLTFCPPHTTLHDEGVYMMKVLYLNVIDLMSWRDVNEWYELLARVTWVMSCFVPDGLQCDLTWINVLWNCLMRWIFIWHDVKQVIMFCNAVWFGVMQFNLSLCDVCVLHWWVVYVMRLHACEVVRYCVSWL